MNQNDAEKLVKALFPNTIILPNSDRSAYDSDEEWEQAMIKHREISMISKMYKGPDNFNQEW
jgi:hypothetical protein